MVNKCLYSITVYSIYTVYERMYGMPQVHCLATSSCCYRDHAIFKPTSMASSVASLVLLHQAADKALWHQFPVGLLQVVTPSHTGCPLPFRPLWLDTGLCAHQTFMTSPSRILCWGTRLFLTMVLEHPVSRRGCKYEYCLGYPGNSQDILENKYHPAWLSDTGCNVYLFSMMLLRPELQCVISL